MIPFVLVLTVISSGFLISAALRRILNTFAANNAVIMSWIYEQHGWPALSWDDRALTTKLVEIRHKQGRLLGRMEQIGFELRQEASLGTLTNDVVKSSAIEGEALDSEEVRSSLAKKLGIDIGGFKPAGRDVEGIVEIMLDATQNYDAPLTDERLFDWHAALFPTGRSGIRKITVGAWRPESAGAMQVISGPFGKERVHYEAPHAARLHNEMNAFLEWYETNQAIDPVLKAGLAHFRFVTIHPFEDGNGRIARAITDIALARADRCKERFYSMSMQIEKDRKFYYDKLEAQQRSDLNVTDWLDWFLDCLDRAFENAEAALGSVGYKARFWDIANRQGINERQRVVLNRMLDDFKGYMSTSKYAKIAKTSPDTALRDIKELNARGLFIQNPGGGRSTSYRLATAEELSANRSVSTRT